MLNRSVKQNIDGSATGEGRLVHTISLAQRSLAGRVYSEFLRYWVVPAGPVRASSGTSSGANVVAAIQVSERLGPAGTVVTLMADSGPKYLSTDVYGRR